MNNIISNKNKAMELDESDLGTISGGNIMDRFPDTAKKAADQASDWTNQNGGKVTGPGLERIRKDNI